MMKLRTAVWWLACLLLARSGAAGPFVPLTDNSEEASNPYAVISERNVFHLNPIPPAPPPEAPKVELPVIKLSGFFRIGRETRALLCALPKDKKEGPSYYNLSEGEKSGSLEVVKIHYDKGEVEVINDGTAMTLSLKADGLVGTGETASNNRGAHPAHESLFHAPFQRPGGANTPFGYPVRPRRLPQPP